jgi:DNA-binding transcriptional regulator PaaX
MINSEKILLAHYFPPEIETQYQYRNYEFLYELFSDVTRGGFRASMKKLVEKKYIDRISLNNRSVFRLSSTGRMKLSMLYPALAFKDQKKENKDFQGSFCILLKAPNKDAHFNLLRSHLIRNGFVFVNRGVYFTYHHQINETFLNELLSNYSSSILLVSIKEFSLGSIDSLLRMNEHSEKVKKSLSEVSSSLVALLGQNSNKKNLLITKKYNLYAAFVKAEELIRDLDNSFSEKKAIKSLVNSIFDSYSKVIKSIYFSQ